ncbi:protein ILITYHIA [Tanacetum coccineum]
MFDKNSGSGSSSNEQLTVRSSAASALGKLSALSTRVDPLVGDLLSNLQVMPPSNGGVREAILVALKDLVKHDGKSVSAPVKTRVNDLLKEMIYNDDDQIRSSSARILGIISEVRIILPVIIILCFFDAC